MWDGGSVGVVGVMAYSPKQAKSLKFLLIWFLKTFTYSCALFQISCGHPWFSTPFLAAAFTLLTYGRYANEILCGTLFAFSMSTSVCYFHVECAR